MNECSLCFSAKNAHLPNNTKFGNDGCHGNQSATHPLTRKVFIQGLFYLATVVCHILSAQLSYQHPALSAVEAGVEEELPDKIMTKGLLLLLLLSSSSL